MAVRKIDASYWVDIRWKFRRYRKRSPVNSKAGAQAYEATLRQALAQGEDLDAKPAPAPPAPETFRAFAERWVETYVRANNKPSEQKTKKVLLRAHLLPTFGALPLAAVTAGRIEEFKQAQLARGLHPKTINNQLVVLLKALRCAADWGHLERVPRVHSLPKPPVTYRWLTHTEQQRLLQASMVEPEWHPMVLLALWSGLRLGELLGLDWSDVDWSRRCLTVHRAWVDGVLVTPKSNRTRTIPLPGAVLNALDRLRQPGGPIFRREDGRRRSDWSSTQALQRAAARAGLACFGWHTLRHTYATTLAMNGTPLRIVQELLGHSSITMTERYAHASPDAMRAATEELEKAFARVTQSEFGQPVGKVGAVPLADSPCTHQRIANVS